MQEIRASYPFPMSNPKFLYGVYDWGPSFMAYLVFYVVVSGTAAQPYSLEFDVFSSPAGTAVLRHVSMHTTVSGQSHTDGLSLKIFY